MPRLYLQLLGQFALRLADTPVSLRGWGNQNAQHLLKVLALAPQQRLSTESLIEALWPESERELARRSLYQALYIARKKLDPNRTGLLTIAQEQVQLGQPGDIETDLEQFLVASRQAQQRRQLADYSLALSLYTGPLLPTDPYAEWAIAAREQAQQIYQQLLVATADLYQEQGEFALARQTWERLLLANPTYEPAHVALMQLAQQQGQWAQALHQYQTLAAVLQQELGTTPDLATTRLYNAMLAQAIAPGVVSASGGQSDQPLPVTRNRQTTTLPLVLTPLFGREEAIATVQVLLERARLVTLTGAGGVGKTRLALAVAQACAGGGAPVWWIELAGLSDPALVVPTVAQVLGIQAPPTQSLEEALVAYGQAQPLLLVLDNCEHLLAACAALATMLLTHCAEVQILATSRIALRVAGEVVWLVPSLPIPTPVGVTATVGELRDLVMNPAVQVFLTIAQTRRPDWTLARQEAAALVTICQQVEGVPLALELAAGRLMTLPLPQLAQRLQQALLVLADGPRSAPTRQQTLRATLDWSYQLLTGNEQLLLAELSVFADGWTLAAAEAVCSLGGQVLPALASLVEQSLVQVVRTTEPGQEGRYRLLETVRQYAQEQLAMLADLNQIQERHAQFVATLATMLAPQLNGPEMLVAQQQLNADLANIRVALGWCLQHGQIALALQVASDLEPYWHSQGHDREGLSWLTNALANSELAPDSPVQLRARVSMARIASLSGQAVQGSTWLREVLPAVRALGDPYLLADTLLPLAQIIAWLGEIEAAWAYTDEAMAIVRDLQDPLRELIGLNGYHHFTLFAGDYGTSLTYAEAALQVARRGQAVRFLPTLLTNVGHLQVGLGQKIQGVARMQEALTMAWQYGDMHVLLLLFIGTAWATKEYNASLAVSCLGAAKTLSAQLGRVVLPQIRLYLLEPAENYLQATLGAAAYAAAHTAGEQQDLPTAYVAASTALVEYLASLGDAAESENS